MEPGGWVLLVLAWSGLTCLVTFCFWRLLGGARRKPNGHSEPR